MLENKQIIIGITGGIAAYKTCELVRLLVKQGANVNVVMTRAAQKLITPLTFQALSQNQVHTELFDLTEETKIGHIDLADQADLICVAPATADFLAKAAHGFADDLLSTILLAASSPIILAPAMNVHMWHHPATQQNIGRVKEFGYQIIEPTNGEMACGHTGTGRMCEPEDILSFLCRGVVENRESDTFETD